MMMKKTMETRARHGYSPAIGKPQPMTMTMTGTREMRRTLLLVVNAVQSYTYISFDDDIASLVFANCVSILHASAPCGVLLQTSVPTLGLGSETLI